MAMLDGGLRGLVRLLVVGLVTVCLVVGMTSDASAAPREAAAGAKPTPTKPKVLASKNLKARVGGTVRTSNGVSITVPARVMKRNGRVAITELQPGVYDIHITPKWSGKVKIVMPLVDGHPLIAHMKNGVWKIEKAQRVGKSAVAKVDSLSVFTSLITCAKKLTTSSNKRAAAINAAKCLVALGIKKAPEWIGKKIIGFFNEYDACKPLSTSNWTIDWVEVLTSPCGLTEPTPPPPAPPTPPPPPPTTPGTSVASYSVMNTSESLPDGVWFRNSAASGDTSRVTGHGVYAGDTVGLVCYVFGEAVGAYQNRLWYLSVNQTRPTVPTSGAVNSGYLNAHYINDGTVANQIAAGVNPC